MTLDVHTVLSQRSPLRWGLLLPALFALISAQPARGCAVAPASEQRVQVVEESAIIVWNAKNRRQHFIRRATFDATTPDFGFLVPTPNRPELAAASDAAFTHLERLMEPERRTEVLRGIDWSPLIFAGGGGAEEAAESAGNTAGAAGGAADDSVQVLQTQRVAGYDAAILEADDADALSRWLKKNGYASSPALTEWFKPYIKARWKITAFKIAAGDKTQRISSSAVRMSFTTECPFFPYREPADQRPETSGEPASGSGQENSFHSQSRMLRVFVLSTERMDGALDASTTAVKMPKWPAYTEWTDQLQESQRATLAQKAALQPEQLPALLWMTSFMDTSAPRPGVADLFFAPARNQNRIVPPPIITVRDERRRLPADLLFGLLLVVGIVGVAYRLNAPEKMPRER